MAKNWRRRLWMAPRGARAPTKFVGTEKGTEREVDNLSLRAPLDLKSYPHPSLIPHPEFRVSEKITEKEIDGFENLTILPEKIE